MRRRLARALPLVVLLAVLSGLRLLPAHAAISTTTTGVYTVTETGPDTLVVGQPASYTFTYTENIPLLAIPIQPAITISAGASAITITNSSTAPFPCLPFSQAASPVSYSGVAQCGGSIFLELIAQPSVTFTITLTPTSVASGGLTVASSETSVGGPGVLVSLTATPPAPTPVAPIIVITNPPVTLGIAIKGHGSLTPPASTLVNQLQAIPVRAVPDPGSVFVGWTGGPCSGTTINPCDIAPNGMTIITATFTP